MQPSGPPGGESNAQVWQIAARGALNDQDFIFTGARLRGVRSLWVVDDDTSTNSFILGNVNGSAAPELQIIVADGAAVAADWVAGDFIV